MKSLLKGIDGSPTSKMTCLKVKGQNLTTQSYESGVPSGLRRNRLARQNWEEWRVEVECPDKQILCGLEVQIEGEAAKTDSEDDRNAESLERFVRCLCLFSWLLCKFPDCSV